MDWIDLAHVRVLWGAFVNLIIKLRVHKMREIFYLLPSEERSYSNEFINFIYTDLQRNSVYVKIAVKSQTFAPSTYWWLFAFTHTLFTNTMHYTNLFMFMSV